jgi:hypothetical protein
MIASGPTHATAENLKAEAYQKLKMSPSNVTHSSVRPRTLFRTSAALFTAVSNQAATPVAANTFIFFGSLYDLEVGVPMMICGLLITYFEIYDIERDPHHLQGNRIRFRIYCNSLKFFCLRTCVFKLVYLRGEMNYVSMMLLHLKKRYLSSNKANHVSRHLKWYVPT